MGNVTVLHAICWLFHALTIFGFGLTIGKSNGIEDWQFWGYIALILISGYGANA